MTEKENAQTKIVVWTELLSTMYNMAYELHNESYVLDIQARESALNFLKISNENCKGNEHALINVIHLVIERAQYWKEFFNEANFHMILQSNIRFSSLFNGWMKPFFSEYDRLMDNDFQVTDLDNVMFQKKTTGIVESAFNYMNSFTVKM